MSSSSSLPNSLPMPNLDFIKNIDSFNDEKYPFDLDEMEEHESKEEETHIAPNQGETDILTSLPSEVLLNIVENYGLSARDQASLNMASRRLKDCIKDCKKRNTNSKKTIFEHAKVSKMKRRQAIQKAWDSRKKTNDELAQFDDYFQETFRLSKKDAS